MSVNASIYAHDHTTVVVSDGGVPQLPFTVIVTDARGVGFLHLSVASMESLAAQAVGVLAVREADAAGDAFHEHVLAETQEQDR